MNNSYDLIVVVLICNRWLVHAAHDISTTDVSTCCTVSFNFHKHL